MLNISDDAGRAAHFAGALQMGDNGLILSHRLTQWVGHAHAVEEDIALANIALDLLGQARAWLSLAGQIEGRGRDEDALAFFRGEEDFRHFLLTEQPNGDFAGTMMRQFLFDARQLALLEKMVDSTNADFAAIAAKTLKETRYHIRHSALWVRRLAGGGGESRRRINNALSACLPYCDEMFGRDKNGDWLAAAGVMPRADKLRPLWRQNVGAVFMDAGLPLPATEEKSRDQTAPRPREHLSRILAELQYLPRQYPQAKW